MVNQAYGVLRAPLSRANYLLMLLGAAPSAEGAEGTTIDDPELLVEVVGWLVVVVWWLSVCRCCVIDRRVGTL